MKAKRDKSLLELAVGLLEDCGFHVSEVKEERCVPIQGGGHVIDEQGVKSTGALLLRVEPIEKEVNISSQMSEKLLT